MWTSQTCSDISRLQSMSMRTRGHEGLGPQTLVSLLKELICDRHVVRTSTAAPRLWQT